MFYTLSHCLKYVINQPNPLNQPETPSFVTEEVEDDWTLVETSQHTFNKGIYVLNTIFTLRISSIAYESMTSRLVEMNCSSAHMPVQCMLLPIIFEDLRLSLWAQKCLCNCFSF